MTSLSKFNSVGAARVAALSLLWGSSFLWIKLSLESFTPIQITLVRMILGAATLFVVAALLRIRLPSGRTTWLHLTVASIFGNVIPYFLFAVGGQYVSSAVAGVINASAPIWTVLITIAAYRSRESASKNAASLIIGFAGVLLIFSPWNHGTELASWGAIACLGAAVSYGVSYVYISRFLAGKGTSVIPMATGQLVCAAVISIVLVPVLGWDPKPMEVLPVAALFFLGIFCTGLAYILNYRIITDDGATAAAIVVYLLPVVSIGLGVLVADESIPLQVIVGVTIVLVAISLRRSERIHLDREKSRMDFKSGNSIELLHSPITREKLYDPGNRIHSQPANNTSRGYSGHL